MRDGKVGAICDVCGRKIKPEFVIKIKALYIADSTGSYKQLGKCDMCMNCCHKKLIKYLKNNEKGENA
jgi:hypothetical protein